MFREANRCFDNLAKAGYSFSRNFVVLDSPLTDDLCNILNADAAALSWAFGYGSLTPYQKSNTSCGYATIIASWCSKFLQTEAYPTTRHAPFVKAKRSPSSTF
ncbi:hypothetical protein CFP56_005180 [Quercus suber]|uniref:RNase H type-1 domain-containing protein n=1 Tax=Quercus suber TaxID=58331 RepID=A0AAW0LBM7_QUESU